MIAFELNGGNRTFAGDERMSLLKYLRDFEGLLSVKDGCSGQAAGGACVVAMNGTAVLSCVTAMKKIDDAKIVTIEGFPESLRNTLSRAFVKKGAVQCGFCTPGFLSGTKILLETNPNPTRQEIARALRFNLCRCTGYGAIVEAVLLAAKTLRENGGIALESSGRVGAGLAKYDALDRAIGKSPFVDDLRFDDMLHGALAFTDHPRANVLDIDCSAAEELPGVVRIFTAADIPGQRKVGVISNDWPVMTAEGGTTRYIGDVLAGVVAESEETARKAVSLIRVCYKEREPLTDMLEAENSPIKIHEKGNVLETCEIKRGGDALAILASAAHVVERTYTTQRVEHGFIETEAAVAQPWGVDGVKVHVQSQGVYEDQRQIARLLGIPPEKVSVTLMPCGGAFGGKEDLTVQGHAALFSYLLKRPVKVKLTRPESIRMHPKRHPMRLQYKLGCDEKGNLTALHARIIGDTGAYASLGAEVLGRAASHATGAYHVPSVDIASKAVYTNNIPCGAMRGFGVNQATFAMESAVDELCEKGGFDRWQFRYDNALVSGSLTATGQILGRGVGVRETLLAVKEEFYKAEYAGLACGIKNCGIGNGVVDESEVKIEIKSGDHIILHHGWTEMGQGVHTVAIQILCEELQWNAPEIIEVKVCTESRARAGMTTASRATSLLGNAIIDAAKAIKKDLETRSLDQLAGKTYTGRWRCDWTTGPGDPGEVQTHFSYGYATHLVVLNKKGEVDVVYAAHDAGRIINPVLFESQIQGAVMMGLGYALTEDLPMEKGRLKVEKLSRLGIPRIKDAPRIVVKGVEVKDPHGPYGAKGVGEIGLVPTAPAVANALHRFDNIRRLELPMGR